MVISKGKVANSLTEGRDKCKKNHETLTEEGFLYL